MMIRTSSLQKEGGNNFYCCLPSSVIMSPPPQWVMERVTYNKCTDSENVTRTLLAGGYHIYEICGEKSPQQKL